MIASEQAKAMVLGSLRYTKAGLGRSLIRDIPSLGLCCGDRLEPSAGLPNVPFEVCFWRMTAGDRVLHQSPLFGIKGVGPESFAIDLLHTWHLGCLARYIGHSLRFLVKSGIFAPPLHSLSGADRNRLALQQIKGELWCWYATQRQRDRNWQKRSSQAPGPNVLSMRKHGFGFAGLRLLVKVAMRSFTALVKDL